LKTAADDQTIRQHPVGWRLIGTPYSTAEPLQRHKNDGLAMPAKKWSRLPDSF